MGPHPAQPGTRLGVKAPKSTDQMDLGFHFLGLEVWGWVPSPGSIPDGRGVKRGEDPAGEMGAVPLPRLTEEANLRWQSQFFLDIRT